jgi:hypothetical protein
MIGEKLIDETTMLIVQALQDTYGEGVEITKDMLTGISKKVVVSDHLKQCVIELAKRYAEVTRPQFQSRYE